MPEICISITKLGRLAARSVKMQVVIDGNADRAENLVRFSDIPLISFCRPCFGNSSLSGRG
jgi:hypothetical protein